MNWLISPIMAKIAMKIAIMSCVFLLIGCEGSEGPQGPPGSVYVYVTGRVYKYYWNDTVYGTMYIAQAPSVPTVILNNQFDWSVNYIEDDEFYFHDTDLPVSPGDSIHFDIAYLDLMGDSAFAWCDLVLPDTFSVITPDTSGFMEPVIGENLTFSWVPSSGADCYYVFLTIHYSFKDSLGASYYEVIDADTVSTDTSITYDAEFVFPNAALIDTVDYCWGSFTVRAQHGPWQAGSMGNLSGDAVGFIYGWTFAPSIDLEIAQPD